MSIPTTMSPSTSTASESTSPTASTTTQSTESPMDTDDDLPPLTTTDGYDSDDSQDHDSPPPVSRTRRTRLSYTLKLKKLVVSKIDKMRAANSSLTITEAMASMGYRNYYYSRWKRDILVANEVLAKRLVVDKSTVPGFIPNETHRKIHTGKVGILEPIAKELQEKVFELRNKGLQVGVDTVMREASRLSPTYKNKSPSSKRNAAQRFVKRIGLSYRAPTHVAQKHHKETELLARAFIDMVRRRVENMHPEAVANMDQTPIPFSYPSNKTLNVKGAKTIHLLAPGDKDRCTFNAGITMAGGKLKPLLVFKGQAGGRIEKRELPTFSTDAFWYCQKNAWCDDRVMKEWIIKVLPLWLADLKAQFGDEHIIPLLILDAYKCHMDGNNVRMIQDMGIELLIIPGGCTYLCQPLDVGVNRSLKVSVKSQWDDWMESEGAVTLQKPSRELIGKWVLKAWDDLEAQTIRKSWKKKDFEWVL